MIGAPSRQPAVDQLVPPCGWDDGVVGLPQADGNSTTLMSGTFNVERRIHRKLRPHPHVRAYLHTVSCAGPICQRRDVEIDAFAFIGTASSSEREFGEDHNMALTSFLETAAKCQQLSDAVRFGRQHRCRAQTWQSVIGYTAFRGR